MKELLIKIRALFEGSGTDQAAQGLDKVAQAAEKAEQATNQIGSNAGQVASGLNDLGNAAGNAGQQTSGLSGGLLDGNAKAGIFAGGVAALGTAVINFAGQAIDMAVNALKNLVAGFVEGIMKAADFAGKMTDLAARTGAPIESLVVLQKAFENAGLSAEQVGPMINRLQKSLAGVNENGEPTAEVFDRLGLSIQELQNQTPAAQFEAIAQAISQLPNPTQQAAAAMEIFGRGGGQLLAVLKDGQAFATAAQQVGSLGANTAKAAASLDTFSDAMGSLDDKKMGFFMGAAAQFATDLERAGVAINGIDLGPLGEQVGIVIRGAIEVNKELLSWISYIKQFTDALGITGPLVDTIKQAFINALGPMGQLLEYFYETGQAAVETDAAQAKVTAEIEASRASAQALIDRMNENKAIALGTVDAINQAATSSIDGTTQAATNKLAEGGQQAQTGIQTATAAGTQEIQLTAQQIQQAAQQLALAFQTGMGQDISPAIQALVDSVLVGYRNVGLEFRAAADRITASVSTDTMAPLQALSETIINQSNVLTQQLGQLNASILQMQTANEQSMQNIVASFQNLSNSFAQNMQTLTSAQQNMTTQLSSAVQSGTSQMASAVSSGVSGIASAFSSAVNSIWSAINSLQKAIQALAARG